MGGEHRLRTANRQLEQEDTQRYLQMPVYGIRADFE